jgi:hypothetical protein
MWRTGFRCILCVDRPESVTATGTTDTSGVVSLCPPAIFHSNQGVFCLEVAWLNSFAPVRFGSSGSVSEKLLDVVVECVVEIVCYVPLDGVSDSGFDDDVCHSAVCAGSALERGGFAVCVTYVLSGGAHAVTVASMIITEL